MLRDAGQQPSKNINANWEETRFIEMRGAKVFSPAAQEIRKAFLNWTHRKGGLRLPVPSYALYASFFATLPAPEQLWEDLVSVHQASLLYGLHYRFMGAVKYLLLKGADHPLKTLYPELYNQPSKTVDATPGELFYDFCRTNWSQLVEVAANRTVQINKIGRCSLFVPLFAEAFARGCRKPLTLIEIGSSAGFGLLWPKLNYSYGNRGTIGALGSDVSLKCRLRGGSSVQVPASLPPVRHQLGLDISPLDVSKEDDALWLLALTAPNDRLNQRLVRDAITLVRNSDLEIREGCVLESLPSAFSQADIDSTLVIFHSLTLHHLREQNKIDRYHRLLRDLSMTRGFFEVGVEWPNEPDAYGKPVPIKFGQWANGDYDENCVGVTDRSADGTWIICR